MIKKITLLFVLVIGACSVEDATPTKPTDNQFDESAAVLIKQGDFSGIGGHSVSGKVKVYESSGKYTIVLDPYSSQNGPDLKVYLSKDVGASMYINLGPLKSIMGSQSYAIPGNPMINDFTYVHIWCERYSVEFARAALQ